MQECAPKVMTGRSARYSYKFPTTKCFQNQFVRISESSEMQIALPSFPVEAAGGGLCRPSGERTFGGLASPRAEIQKQWLA